MFSSQEKRKEFENKFQPDVQNGPLKAIHYTGYYVAAQITTDPSLLKEDWLELSKKLWKEIYAHAGIEMSYWMISIDSPESVEEGFEDEKEHYGANIKAFILRNAKVSEYDSEKEKVNTILLQRKKLRM